MVRKSKYRDLDREQDSVPPGVAEAWRQRQQHHQQRRHPLADSGTSLFMATDDSDLCSCTVLNPCQQPWFPPTVHDSTLRITSTPLALVWKSLVTLFAVVMYMYAMGRMQVTAFFFAYFTYWAATANCVYLLLSCWNSWLSFLDETAIVATWCIHCTWKPMWLLFEVSTHSALGSTVGMWGSIVYFGGIEAMKQGEALDASDIVWHGLMLILTFVDGVVFNTIEYRWVHWSGVLVPLALVYILWTVLHAFAIGENPEIEADDDTFNDDAIYAIIVWKDDWKSSLFVCFVTFIGLGFLAFGFLRLASSRIRSYMRRRSHHGVYAWLEAPQSPRGDITSSTDWSMGEDELATYA